MASDRPRVFGVLIAVQVASVLVFVVSFLWEFGFSLRGDSAVGGVITESRIFIGVRGGSAYIIGRHGEATRISFYCHRAVGSYEFEGWPEVSSRGPLFRVRVPLWIPFGLGMILVCLAKRRTQTADGPVCPQCQYCILGIESEVCPECGHALNVSKAVTSQFPFGGGSG